MASLQDRQDEVVMAALAYIERQEFLGALHTDEEYRGLREAVKRYQEAEQAQHEAEDYVPGRKFSSRCRRTRFP